MKTAKLFLSLALFFCAGLHAQVTIGSLNSPEAGAILDLNSTTKGGLLLSNVELLNLYTIPYTGTTPFPGITPGNHESVKGDFAGAIVYHTGENGFPAGVYLWNGENWSPAGEDCRALTPGDLILTGLPFAKVNTPVNFSVSSKLSARCSGGETFTWSATGPDAVTFTPSSGTATSVMFPVEGEYTLTVTAQNAYMPASITKTLTVSVNSDGSVPFALLDGVYGIVGPVCLDAKVKKQPSTQSDEAFAARVDAFAGTANCTKTYRFIHSDTYSNLNLILLDPAGLVESMTPPASDGAIPVTDVDKEKAFTLTFKSDIKNRVPSDGDSLTVKLIATYINNNNIPKVAYLEIRIEDGICVCPAKVSDTEWLNFMCHNLGGPDIISSYQLITREHHGNWYRFGASRVSMENLEENDALRNWTTGSGAIPTYYAMETGYTGNISVWPDNLNANIANPCPAGWRLPLITELATVLNKNTANSDIAVINPLSNVPASWVPPGNQTFSNLKKSGDYLYLPAAGLREYLTGTLLDRGKEGYYWSSNGNMVNNAWWGRFDSGRQIVGYVNRSYGASVRCVEAE